MDPVNRTNTSVLCDAAPRLERPNVVFDFGNVLIQWNPERLLREFAQDKEELNFAIVTGVIKLLIICISNNKKKEE